MKTASCDKRYSLIRNHSLHTLYFVLLKKNNKQRQQYTGLHKTVTGASQEYEIEAGVINKAIITFFLLLLE